jgi:hypothetical protein
MTEFELADPPLEPITLGLDRRVTLGDGQAPPGRAKAFLESARRDLAGVQKSGPTAAAVSRRSDPSTSSLLLLPSMSAPGTPACEEQGEGRAGRPETPGLMAARGSGTRQRPALQRARMAGRSVHQPKFVPSLERRLVCGSGRNVSHPEPA